jgi:NodT family efflux transporter outer membrane factor (OMF) lipoprotein
MKNLLSCFPAFLILAGCSLAPDYTPPDVPTPPWRGAEAATDIQAQAAWWASFGNSELEGIIKEALASNNDINSALYRLEQARAAVKISGAGLLPAIDASGNASKNYNNPAHGANSVGSAYRANVQASYELDLFGRNRADVESAQSSAQASEYDKEALALITASDTATDFVGILALNDRLKVARENLANARDVLRIIEERFAAGTLSALELAQQKIALANTEAGIASLAQQRETLLNQLALLLAKTPQDFTLQSAGLDSLTLPPISPIQPAQLLTRRPDIRAAEARLAAANYDIGVARANFFPVFQISASSALAASPISAPAALANALAAAISAPVFEGGALEGGLEIAKARRGELEEQYKKTVLTSFQEVQDALASEEAAGIRVTQLTEAAKQSQNAYDISRQRFDSGTIDFLTLLSAQASLLSAQDALIGARSDQFSATIGLYKSLGGGRSYNSGL